MAIDTFKRFPIGGGLVIFSGNYAQTVGAADLTFALGAMRVLGVMVTTQDANGAYDAKWGNYTESVSGSTNTVTVNGLAPVTSGRILVFALGGQ